MTGSQKANSPLVAWDSCVFLGWFKKEHDKDLYELECILHSLKKEQIVMLVSAVVCVEVMDQAGKSTAGTDFRSFVNRSNVLLANADWRVAEKAVLFREKVTEMKKAGKMKDGLKAPDAMIAATAAIYRADELHTYDPVLLALSGCEELDGLVIKEPAPLGRDTPLFKNIAK